MLRLNLVLTRFKLITTFGFLFCYITKAKDIAKQGYLRGTFFINLFAYIRLRILSIMSLSFFDKLYKACFKFKILALSLNNTSIITLLLNLFKLSRNNVL
jgi:hypothetical protein